MNSAQRYIVFVGDAAEVALGLGPFDAVLCDPPYGLGFMSKAWDYAVPGPELWAAVRDELRPGAHLVAFGGTRLYHRLACSIEDAGFEIRDCLMWLYGSGFPKSHNAIGERHAGYGTALKPAWEPAILARKPLSETVAANCLEHGTGALNIDGGRVGTGDSTARTCNGRGESSSYNLATAPRINDGHAEGRWPANVVLDDRAGALLDEQVGELTSGMMRAGQKRKGIGYSGGLGDTVQNDTYGDSGGASRFFYCAKASRSEREAGLAHRTPAIVNDGRRASIDNAHQRGDTLRRNAHPTVKPVDLCRWLATLLLPPQLDRQRRILVPFSGSGSEMIGCLLAGWDEVVGVELSSEYAEIARARLVHWDRYRCAESEAAALEALGQQALF